MFISPFVGYVYFHSLLIFCFPFGIHNYSLSILYLCFFPLSGKLFNQNKLISHSLVYFYLSHSFTFFPANS